MADSHDRAEASGGGFIVGLLVGLALGAGLGIALAPKAGADLRGEIRRRARDVGQQAADRYHKAGETAIRWAERGRDAVDHVRSDVSKGAEEARRFTARTAGEHGTDPAASES